MSTLVKQVLLKHSSSMIRKSILPATRHLSIQGLVVDRDTFKNQQRIKPFLVSLKRSNT